MPHVDEDLNEGLRISETATGYQLTRTFFCKDLTGGTPSDVLYQALQLTAAGTAHTGANIPVRWDSLLVGPRTFWCKDRDADPWPPADAIVRTRWDTDEPPVAGVGPTIVEVGAALEQSETDFDEYNRQLPFAQRTPITIGPPASKSGQPVQSVRVPLYIPKPSVVLSRQETSSPEDRADTYVGWTNADVWRGYAQDTILCVEIRGRNSGDGIWWSTYSFLRDRLGKWEQVVRWRDTDGTFPELTQADVAASAGIKLIAVQGSRSFSGLNL